MHIIDLQLYRNKRAFAITEKKLANLMLMPGINGAEKIKICFREFIELLEKTGTK